MTWKARIPRIVKHPTVRKAEFLAAARALFFERGYDRTSIDDVIGRACVSKGAFYHHFASKEELLGALAADIARETVEQLGDILEDPTLNAFERLNGFLARGRQLKVAAAPQLLHLFDAIFRAENVMLYHRTHLAVNAVMTPVLARIIEQGIGEGTFRATDAEITAELLLQISAASPEVIARLISASTPAQLEVAATALERRAIEQGIAVDRLLGLPDGSIEFIEPGFVKALIAARCKPQLVAPRG
ncbi:MAG: TetR/AcrR family transcriptional regulator [Devosia sp.]|nr:TetR/AcrR family transcriptional regulator [Devosia sp.]